jgi:hypothetical protein
MHLRVVRVGHSSIEEVGQAGCIASPEAEQERKKPMKKIQTLLIGSAFAAIASSSAFAQTAQPADAGAQMSAQVQGAPGTPGVTPPPQNLVAPASNDPLVQKRNANAQANAEYRASKKASKEQLKATSKEAKAQYKEEVRNAKINQKADKQTAKDELNAAEPSTPKDSGLQH